MSEELPGTAARFVAGTRSHEQARSLVGLWEPLADALRSLEDTGQDVIVDGGRLGLNGSPEPLVAAADLALLVTRTDLVSLAGARSWAESLREQFARDGAAASLGVLLVGEGAPFRAREVARVLRVPVLSSVVWDPAGAAVLSHGAEPPQVRRWHRWMGRADWTDSPLHGEPARHAQCHHRRDPDERRAPRRGRSREARVSTDPIVHPSTDPSDPTALPLFAANAPQGRVRGTFSLRPAAQSSRAPATLEDVRRRHASPRPATIASSGPPPTADGSEIDWGLVRALRTIVAGRLTQDRGEGPLGRGRRERAGPIGDWGSRRARSSTAGR